MTTVRWGVLGAARIALTKVVPAMQKARGCEVAAIASRELDKARAAAAALGIPKAYGSYDELLADPELDAVYNPLPNHLHVPWTIRAAERGKHVLCEKPIALGASEARELLALRDRTGVRIQEAFMVRTHPQWERALEIVRSGRIGALRAVSGHFSYFNDDPANVRNVAEWGGGALMDIGCYPILGARLLFAEEPRRVVALLDRDPRFGTDRLGCAILDFPSGQAVFSCATQLVPWQRIQAFGTRGRVELEIPFNAPNDRPCRLLVDDGSDLFGRGIEVQSLATCDQYTIQAERFAEAIRGRAEPSFALEESIRNMQVIDALVRSSRSGAWEEP